MSISSSRVVRFPSAEARAFGKYTLLAKLGQGGMADVFLSVSRGPGGFNKLVVIKRLKPDVGEDPEFRTMFHDEGRLAARLNHANIVQANEVGEIEGHPYLAMEYLDGQPLNRVVPRVTKSAMRPLDEYLRIVCDALAGLHYAHELCDFDGTPLSVVHRDVSPHNIFVTYDGQVKVVDFGIAKAATRSQHTSTGVVKGKISYMAPEQALCAPVDRRADVFSVGLILWELVSGKRFWGDLSEVQILKKMAFGDVPTLKEAWPEVPEEIDRICAKAIAMVPADRYATAAEFREDLERYIASQARRATAADVGKLVADLFQDRREEVRGVIQDRLAKLKVSDGGSEREVPLIDMHPDATLPPDRQARSARSARLVPSDDEPRSTSGIISTEPTKIGPANIPTKSGLPTVAIAVGALVVVAALVLGLRMGGESSPSETAPDKPATTAEARALISVEIAVEPAEAVIYVDDTRVGQNPFRAKFPSDGTGHKLRVEAPGYVPHSELLVFSGDLSRTIRLVKDVAPESTGTPASSASASPSAVTSAPPPPPQTGKWPPPKPPPPQIVAPPPPPPGGPGVIQDDPWKKKKP